MSQIDDLRAILRALPPLARDSHEGIDRAKRIRDLLEVPHPTGLTTAGLREITNTFVPKGAIGEDVRNWPDILSALLACLSARNLCPFEDASSWREVLQIGSSYEADGQYTFHNARVEAVASAGRSLIAKGYRITAEDDHYTFAPGELERATHAVRSAFDQLGAKSR